MAETRCGLRSHVYHGLEFFCSKARLHPTKEGGPKQKRRKIGTSTQDYVDIQEIWSKQATSEQEIHKKTPTENSK